MTDEPVLYCANHPNVETTLRCNRCEKPICTRCAVHTPTGYRCRECVRGQQKTFNTAEWYDYLIAVAVAGILSFIGSQFVRLIGFFTLFVAPIGGVIIAEAIRFLLKRRRSKRLFQLSAVAAAIGSLPPVLINILAAIFFLSQSGSFNFGFLLPLVWQAVYTVTVTSSVYYRLSGISI